MFFAAAAQGALLHAPRVLLLLLFDVLLTSAGWTLALLIGVLAFNHLIPEYTWPVENTRAVLPIAALATLVNWRRRVKAMKKVI